MSAPGQIKRTVSKSDIEAKFRELQGDVNDQAESARTTAAAIGAVVAVVVVLGVFLFGKRRGRKGTTIVEVRRI
jgi:hypothetical protein